VGKSSKCCNDDGAHEVAPSVIQEAYDEAGAGRTVPWDEALELLDNAAKAHNLRPGTLEVYRNAVATVRRTFPGLRGPAQLTDRLARQHNALRRDQVTPRTLAGNSGALHMLPDRRI
jgi:hypothetical protein